ncbi:MAG: hypothetical protein CMQ41_07515 [Gammaproteobacteria bacterium]|nr:hypothetical protein [Gammaproteobacteria bacterium]
MSDESQLVEKVKDELLNEDDLLKVEIVEGDSVLSQYEVNVPLTNPYEFDASRFMPNTTPMDLIKFFEIADDLITNAQDRAGIIDSKKVKLVEEYPPDAFSEYGDEVVAFRVLKREPARMNAKATARPHRKSTYSYDVVRAENPNKVVVIESRPIDHLIEFTCWGKSNKIANSRALWLEKLFINHAWVFEVQGVERFFWKDRGPLGGLWICGSVDL